jgi:hypothetical protein
MRLLMFHVESFWYRVNEKEASDEGISLGENLLVWIQSEAADELDRASVLRKTVKNIGWLARKIDLTDIILHPFAHLGESKSEPVFAEGMLSEVCQRLVERDYHVHIVPYGVFTEFKMHVRGPSLAKVFKQL